MGRRTNISLAQSQSPPRKGLRTDHCFSHRMAVRRINTALHAAYRKIMKSCRIILNQTLRPVSRLIDRRSNGP